MKSMTIRGFDDELVSRLRKKADALSCSVNATVLEILRDATGLNKKRYHRVFHDLDDLAGTWSDEEAQAFDEAIAPLSQIDEDLWR